MSDEEITKESRIVLREWPDLIYYWPTVLASIILPLITKYPEETELVKLIEPRTAMLMWLVIYFFNSIVIAFDFGLGNVGLIAMVVFAVILLGVMYVPENYDTDINLDDYIKPETGLPDIFFYIFAVFFIIIYFLYWIRNFFVYWEIRSTEIHHHSGLFEDAHRFGNAQAAHITKSTPDFFERILWLSGDFHIRPAGDTRTYEIKNVFRAAKKDKVVREILSYVPDK